MKIIEQFSKPLQIGAVFMLLLFFIGYDALSPSFLIQQGIAHRILRLHVIANSDSDMDQNVKLMVRDNIISSLRNVMKDAPSAKDAEQILEAHLGQIENTADSILSQNGFNYQSKAEICWSDFPVKEYGDLSFPAGNYRALTVKLGKAKGHNWWCVLFPTLCFTDETYDVITQENKEKFRNLLTPEEYAVIAESCSPTSKKEKEDAPKVFYKSYFAQFFHKK